MDTVKSKNGFTLVEILVVIALLGILVGITVPTTLKVLDVSTKKTMNIQINNIIDATKLLMEDKCKNPTEQNVVCPFKAKLDANKIVRYNGEIDLNMLINEAYIDAVKIRGNSCTGSIKSVDDEIGAYLICGKYNVDTRPVSKPTSPDPNPVLPPETNIDPPAEIF